MQVKRNWMVIENIEKKNIYILQNWSKREGEKSIYLFLQIFLEKKIEKFFLPLEKLIWSVLKEDMQRNDTYIYITLYMIIFTRAW